MLLLWLVVYLLERIRFLLPSSCACVVVAALWRCCGSIFNFSKRFRVNHTARENSGK